MTGDPAWPPPSTHVSVSRRWTYAPPPWVMYQAVVNERDRWLSLLTNEVASGIADSRDPDAVSMSPWIDPAVIAVELRIEPHGPGSAITVLAYRGEPDLRDEDRRSIRHRLGTVFGAALREWVDEPHW